MVSRSNDNLSCDGVKVLSANGQPNTGVGSGQIKIITDTNGIPQSFKIGPDAFTVNTTLINVGRPL